MAQILDFQAAALARSRCDPLSDESDPLVIVAGGGRDLNWPSDQITAALLQASGGRPVLRLLHGGARAPPLTTQSGPCPRTRANIQRATQNHPESNQPTPT